MNKMTITCLLFLFCTSLATAQVYKWRDENGKLVFSDSPPVSAPIAVPIQGSVKAIEVEPPAAKESKNMVVDSGDLYRINGAYLEMTSNNYVYNEVQNAREYLNSLLLKSSFKIEDLMMIDYIRFLFEQPESKPYLNNGDRTSAESLANRGDTAKRSLSAKEKKMVDLGTKMMVGRWQSETYRERDKSEIKELDAILHSLWSQMCAAMANGNIDHTLSFFHSSTRSAYRKRLESFPKDELQRISADMSQQIQFVQDRRGLIEYSLPIERNGEMYSQIVIFQAESDGQWKIKQF